MDCAKDFASVFEKKNKKKLRWSAIIDIVANTKVAVDQAFAILSSHSHQNQSTQTGLSRGAMQNLKKKKKKKGFTTCFF
jgi:hypothetical protein